MHLIWRIPTKADVRECRGALPGGPVVSQGDENQRKYGKFESKAFWIRWWVSQGEMQGGILNEDETILKVFSSRFFGWN